MNLYAPSPLLDAFRSRLWLHQGELAPAFRLAALTALRQARLPSLAPVLAEPTYEAWRAANAASPPELEDLLKRYQANAFARLLATLSAPSAVPKTDANSELEAWQALVPGAFGPLGQGSIDQFALDVDPDTLTWPELVERSTRHPGLVLLVCALSNARLVCCQSNDDEHTWVAARTPDAQGRNAACRFNPRQVALSDEAVPSIAAALALVYGLDSAAPKAPEAPRLDPWLNPEDLARRSAWLVLTVAGVGFGSAALDAEHIPRVSCFEHERRLLHHPHLAVYWLFHHWMAGHRADLEATLEATAGAGHPWVESVRAWIGESQSAGSFELGCLTVASLNQLRAGAPLHAFYQRPEPWVEPPAPEPRPPAPVVCAFRAWIAEAQLTQRERVPIIEHEWLPKLRAAPKEDHPLVTRLLRKALKSPKLAEPRERLLAAFRSPAGSHMS